MFYSSNIREIEIELTTRCNAACPQCSRNFYGGTTISDLPIVDLELSVIKQNIPVDILENLVEIRVCGTYGDPCVYENLIEFVEYINSKTTGQITINTNGSLRTEDWWQRLAKSLKKDDRVIFGIDGLGDTNHLHRIGTNFNKIIKNAKAFIDAGGSAIWSYIVFKHNEHQIEQARKLSEELKFDGFACKYTSRFIDKAHNLVDKTPVYNKHNQVVRHLELPTDENYRHQGYKNYNSIIEEFGTYKNYLQKTDIVCTAQYSSLVYISAEGLVLPCGWLADRLYGHEVSMHEDKQKLLNLIEKHGGLDLINLKNYTLDTIVKNDVFTAIEKNWKEENRIERCANQCGKNGMLKHATVELQKYVKGVVNTESVVK